MPTSVTRLGAYTPATSAPDAEAAERTIAVAIGTTARAGARLEEWIHAGVHEVVITTRDGSGAIRARLDLTPERASDRQFATPGVSVDWATRTITYKRHRAGLSHTETRLLSALAAAEGRPVSRRALIAAAWPRESVRARDSHLTVYMCLLRKRLTSIGLGRAVRTDRGRGYSLSL